MSSRKLKPPLDKKATRARLERAQDEQLVVGVRRWIRGADYLEGFVVGIGARWVALAKLDSRVSFDGWTLLRLKDVQAVTVEPDSDCFTVRALRARSEWPPPSAVVELDDLQGAVSTVSAIAPMTSVFVEFDRPDICYIGSLLSVDETRLRLLEIDTQGHWRSTARSIDPGDVTRIDLGGRYEETLALVAGPPPQN